MIRVTIERVQYELTVKPAPGEPESVNQITDFRPMVTGERKIHEYTTTLLLQEFDDLDIVPIAGYLNGLQTPSLCSCGHSKHSGRCTVSSERMGYSSERCECADYMTTQEKAYLAEIKKSHGVIEDLEIERANHRSVAHERKETIDDLKGQLSSVIRSRDRLRSQKGKRR